MSASNEQRCSSQEPYASVGRTKDLAGAALLVGWALAACSSPPETGVVVEPQGRGPYAVGATNFQVADEYADIGDDAMHAYLLGIPDNGGKARFVADILAHPDAALVVDVPVPDNAEAYGPAAGLSLPVPAFVTFPTVEAPDDSAYRFPYHDSRYGAFEHMLAPGQAPVFADENSKYPLVILSHGASAHGVYDIGHAHSLSSHGFIVLVLVYGDDRTSQPDTGHSHRSYLRPLLTSAVLTELLESETFGPHIDTDNIGITGHSFGGFTGLAVAGGRFQNNPASVTDERITAGVITAPWVGGRYGLNTVYAFGDNNEGLARVDEPMIAFIGTDDDVTEPKYILPATKHLAGPVYVIELVDQTHDLEDGSWQDRNGWELLFYNAYLKGDGEALATLKTARSMAGGNEDVQLFDYQRMPGGL